VAFRFVFKSDNTVEYNGIVIDDIEISATLGELHTTVTLWDAAYDNSNAILNWTTQPEYYCKEFRLERSTNGKDFEEIDVIPATGILTSTPQTYEYELRRIEGLSSYLTFPNPFAQSFTVSFTDTVEGLVKYTLYDTQGRRVWEGEEILSGQTSIDISPPNVAEGTYFLSLTIGEEKPEVIKVVVLR